MINKKLFINIAIILIIAPLNAEEKSYSPAPYEEDEFSQWMHDLRRAEIVLIGTLPLTLFVSNIGFQLVRYAVNEFEPEYAPSLSGAGGSALTETEKAGVLLGAVSASLVISVIDFIIGEIKEKETQRARSGTGVNKEKRE